jgi:hypothetical protein
MNPKFSKKDYELIYEWTADDSPLASDCGQLCNGICCSDTEAYGIYLLPGEESVFTREEDWLGWETQDSQDSGFPDSWEGPVYFLSCNGKCDRSMRPMQCRTYPVSPHITTDGQFILILETLETSYHCPMIENPLYLELFSKQWLHNLYRSWAMLLNDPLIYDLVLLDSDYRRSYNQKILTAYPVDK